MPYSAYTAAALAFLLVALSIHISRLRLKHRIAFGDGGNKNLTMAMRAHGNSLEQSVIFMPLLYFIDMHAGVDGTVVLALGAGFVVARVVYCAALFMRILPVRQVAHVATMLLLIGAAGLIAWSSLG